MILYINSNRRISMLEYWKIFVSFFKIGLFTFGGGYAMIPMFRRELIEKHKYISEDELMDYYSIGQCTPGIIAVNVATFTGYKVKGTWGSIWATFAIILPSLIIIMALAGVLDVVSENQIVKHAFAGIRIGVIVLIFNEVINIIKKNVKNRFQIFILVGALILLFCFEVSSIMAIVIASVLGGMRYWRQK